MINNPNDKIFKEIESIKENAADLINGTFPAGIKNKLDLSTLELVNKNYTDEKLKEYFSDLVYNCYYKDNKIKIVYYLNIKVIQLIILIFNF